MKRGMKMSVEDVRRYFTDRGLKDPVFELSDSLATVELAASAIGVEPGLIAKTLSFQLKDRVVIVVTRGDARIDNKKFKSCFNTKAKMLDPNDVLEITGHPVGGVCPFGLVQMLPVYLDISLKRFDYIYPACGSSNSAIKLTCEELEQYAKYKKWVDVCKGWQEWKNLEDF
jgi:prolyl-tRNA editing enzyme YbaK/EbsC (Cys-tRNA(Pro) deacylase)